MLYQRYGISTEFITDDVNLYHLAKLMFARFLYCSFSPFHSPYPVHALLFGSRSLGRAHTQGMGGSSSLTGVLLWNSSLWGNRDLNLGLSDHII